MTTITQPADKAADLLQKLSLDSQTNTFEVPEATKKPSYIQHGSIDTVGSYGPIQLYEPSTTPQLQQFTDPTMCYLPNAYPSATYYYEGYEGSTHEWDAFSRYMNPNGMEVSPGVYGDNGSLVYHHGYAYAPYGAYSPAGSQAPTMGQDGQLYGPQHYQYPPHFFQSTIPPSGAYTPNQAPAAVQAPPMVEAANGNANGSVNGNNNGPMPLKPSHLYLTSNANGSYGRGGVLPGSIPTSGYQDLGFGFDGMWSPVPWLDGPALSVEQPRPATSSSLSSTFSHMNNIQPGRDQNLRPLQNYMGLQPPRPTPAVMNRIYPNNRMYSQYGSTARTGGAFGSNVYDSRTNGRRWLAVDSKYKTRGRCNGFFNYGNEYMDGLNERNRGPRARGFKNQIETVPITLAVKGQDILLNGNSKDKDNSGVIPDREQYNREDLPEKYLNAKCFIIKSYSEDDVHKSIKYNVWASTPNGNKKLDAAYQEAQEQSGDYPVFLFFSVNTSGQFVGLAEMMGPVDFNKNVEYWQQDKWNGCFSVKWHIVKDVPNSLLKHITLENNDNKPVTNSRDTQEVKFEQGLQMLKIFKDHSSKTCILDDFGFYEVREKTIQEKRAKFQKQVRDGKSNDVAVFDEKEREGTNGNPRLQESLEVTSSSAVRVNREKRQSEEKKLIEIAGDIPSEEKELIGIARDTPKEDKPVVVTEKRVISNGVTNDC